MRVRFPLPAFSYFCGKYCFAISIPPVKKFVKSLGGSEDFFDATKPKDDLSEHIDA